MRPLGIPTIKDRCKQMLMKFALEPEWEAKFENNVYGFRPGYSAADAKRAITRQIQGATKYFLDADIKGCFDNIGHEPLVKKLDTIPMFEITIKAWLKAGIMDNFKDQTSLSNEVGTPQGGVISPLLCNVALHGMEIDLLSQFGRNDVKIIRYADDFVIMGKQLEKIEKAKLIVSDFLATVNLELSEEKTRIGHSLKAINGGKPGLEFLGFYFRNQTTSIHRGVKSTRGVKQNFIQISGPSRDAMLNHKRALKMILKKHKAEPLRAVLAKLSARIRGWTTYFSVTKCTRYFSYMDQWLFWAIWHWAIKRYKTIAKAKKKCFSVQGWKFGFIDKGVKHVLKRHDETRVRKYVKIKAGASIYSGDIMYFAMRMSYHNARMKRLINLLKSQKFRCARCKLRFMPDDIIELHHVLNASGQRTDNIQYIHGHCHDSEHRKA
jgi:RNA-directed DNA polymerase